MSDLKAGIGTERLAVEHPVELAGYGPVERIASETHDPLFVKSVVLSDGSVTVGIVSADVILFSRQIRSVIRKRLAKRNVALDQVMLTATHTHAGPHLPNDVLSLKPSHRDKDVDEDLVDRLQRSVVETLETAHAGLESAILQVGRSETSAASENRRKTGPLSEGTRVPRGEIDPELSVLRIVTDSNEELVLFNFACHPVCLTSSETMVSADWPGVVYDRIEADTGATVMFLNGAAGDINPKEWNGDDPYEFRETIGEAVAETVTEAYDDARDGLPVTTAPISVDRREVRFGVKPVPSVDRLKSQRQELKAEIECLEGDNEEEASRRRTDLTYVEELLALAEWGSRRMPATMQQFEVGPVGILGLPGEVFVRHGLDFKERASTDTLMVAGYTNGYLGYVPTLDELENIGYEVQTSVIAPESIVDFCRTGFDMV